MKKVFARFCAALSAIAAFSLLMASCGHEEPDPTPPTPQTVAVTGVTLSSSSMTLKVGETGTLSYTISPSNATNTNVIWKSNDGSIATIDVSGKVTGVKAGTTTIQVITTDGAKTASCTVTVTASNVAVTGVSLDDASKTLTVEKGKTVTLKPTVEPADASDKTVTFKSSDDKVVTVSAEGVVTGIAEGTATITVTTKDGNKTVTSEVTVVPAKIAVTGITINDDSKEITLEEGETAVLGVTITPEDATDQSIEWTSSDEKVASVDATGKVKALKTGETTITAKTKDGGKTATAKIIVKDGVSITGVTLNNTQMEIPAGETYTFEPEFFPKNATNRNVSWTSSNEKVATIASDGTMTALAMGNTTITVTTEDGAKKAICYVIVTAALTAVSGVELSMSTLNLLVGDKFELEANVKPSTAENKNVSWKSSNSSVASVSEYGVVTALKSGSTTITVTTEEGKFTSSCTVKVDNPGDYTVYWGGGEAPSQMTYTLGSATRDYIIFKLYDKVNKKLVTGESAYKDDFKITSSKVSVAQSIAYNSTERVVKAYYQGTTVLTFSYKGKTIRTLQLTVRPKPEYTIMVGDRNLYEGATALFEVGESMIYQPYDRNNDQTIYQPSGFSIKSSDPSVVKAEIAYLGASSSPTGIFNAWKLTALKAGSATITMTFGTFTRTLKVIVGEFEARYSESLIPSTLTYQLGSATQDYVKFRVYNKSTNSYVNAAYWTVKSSNTSVGEPYSYTEFDFNVHAKKVGKATITISSCYGSAVFGTTTLNVVN